MCSFFIRKSCNERDLFIDESSLLRLVAVTAGGIITEAYNHKRGQLLIIVRLRGFPAKEQRHTMSAHRECTSTVNGGSITGIGILLCRKGGFFSLLLLITPTHRLCISSRLPQVVFAAG